MVVTLSFPCTHNFHHHTCCTCSPCVSGFFQVILEQIHTGFNSAIACDVPDIAFNQVAQVIFLFREKSGLPPNKFLACERINYAKRLLYSSDLTIKEIAEKCGFQSVYYFSRLFKAGEGISPGQYRKQRYLGSLR